MMTFTLATTVWLPAGSVPAGPGILSRFKISSRFLLIYRG
jgi:hypothetical protein